MSASRDTRDPAGSALHAYICEAHSIPRLTEAHSIPRLTAERELTLAQWAAAGDTAAASDLTCAHLRLVISLAKSFVGRGLPLEDLIQEGNLGLVRAVRHFDWRRGIRLAGYAVPSIHGAISDAVAEHEAAAASVAAADVSALADALSDEDTLGPEAAAVTRELVAETQGAMRELLTPRERTVIGQRFGFDGRDRESLDRVGQLGMRREGIRRLEVGAFAKLRRELARPHGGQSRAA